MKKIRVVTVLGTRPEVIKLALLIPMLDKEFDHKVVFTSQHYSRNMSDLFFEEMGVRRPDDVLQVNSSDYAILEKAIRNSLMELNPDYVIVYGDTNSTLAAAKAAKSLGKKLVHIEAGLRSYDQDMPEEYNRVETDKLSDYLFAPTGLCKIQLAKERIAKNVFVVGNTVVDVCSTYSKKIKSQGGDYILLTIHRQENVDNAHKLAELLQALASLNKQIIYPIHPRSEKRLKEFGLESQVPSNVKVIQPTGYLQFLSLLKGAQLVITDAGGVQEEAITLNIPCLTMRGGNERWEAVEAGGNFVVGTEPKLVASYVKQILDGNLGKSMRKAKNPFGDGKASIKIVKALKRLLKK